MRVLVCGSREWTDVAAVHGALYGLAALVGDEDDFVVIQGGAPGADSVASDWVAVTDLADEHLAFPADWDRHGKAAGPIRNQQMIDEAKPDVVIAFKDRFGVQNPETPWEKDDTEDIVQRAKTAGIPVYLVTHP